MVSLSDRFERQAAQSPDAIAFWTADQRLTYAELSARAAGIAAAIIALGFEHPVRIALLFGMEADAVAGMLGLMKTGHAYVPVDPSHPGPRIREVLEDADPALVLTNAAHLAAAREAIGQGRRLVIVDELPPAGPATFPTRDIDPEALMTIIYTSGSTGRPKGVMHTYGGLSEGLLEAADLSEVLPGDRMAMLHGPTTMAGHSDIFCALGNGAAVCPYDIRKQGIAGLADWITAAGITHILLMPTVLRHLARQLPPDFQFPTVRRLRLGGETITSRDFAIFQRHFRDDAKLMMGCGSTEVVGISKLCLRKGDTPPGDLLPCGYPMDRVRFSIMDDELRELPAGHVGQIVVHGGYFSPGYWKDPTETARVFPPDPADPSRRLYLMGDVGYVREDGCLVHLGRQDNQVKIRGNRIEIAEVEAGLLTLPGVDAVGIVPWDDADGERHLVAYYVPAAFAPPSAAELRQGLSQKLPLYMVPSHLIPVESLPRLPGGKLDRNALPAPDAAPAAPAQPSMTPTEEAVLRLWRQILKSDNFSLHDDFFALGGDSLSATGLLAALETEFGVQLSLPGLLQHPTAAEQARLLDGMAATPDAVVQAPDQVLPGVWAFQGGGTALPSFWIPGGIGDAVNIFHYGVLARHVGEDHPCYVLAVRHDRLGTVAHLAADCVQRIRQVQPHGPYLLGAVCGGGVVGLEVARQLAEAGDQPRTVILVDSAAPAFLRRYGAMPIPIAQRLAQSAQQLPRTPLARWPTYLAKKTGSGLKRLAGWLGLRRQAVHPYYRVVLGHEVAPYAGRVVLLANKWAYAIDPRMGWDATTLPELRVECLFGHHSDWLGDGIVETADHVRAALDRAMGDLADAAG